MNTAKKEIIKAIQEQSRAGFAFAEIFALAKRVLSKEDFGEICIFAGVAPATGLSYAKVGSDEALKWAVNDNIINANIGCLVRMTGIPVRQLKAAHRSGALQGLKQKTAGEIRRKILGDTAPPKRGRKLLVDSWSDQWRGVADKIIKLNLAASALKDQIGATVSDMKSQGYTDASARKSLLDEISANLANVAVNGTRESIEVLAHGYAVTMVPTDPKSGAITVEVKL
jgi:hypothetical protein